MPLWIRISVALRQPFMTSTHLPTPLVQQSSPISARPWVCRTAAPASRHLQPSSIRASTSLGYLVCGLSQQLLGVATIINGSIVFSFQIACSMINLYTKGFAAHVVPVEFSPPKSGRRSPGEPSAHTPASAASGLSARRWRQRQRWPEPA